ncbi:hypothetical protein SSBR45G_10710 [Bradyrhizobium sp. SSBR45G]|uniref:hypothetical protein n=1 Tax=unclassified Bradyrhizobium TaxID=2631580 RepID=UPI0023429AC2|nr:MULTISPECIES: hypothetical protein [unclassified Bradyrhizobium]GLH76163.1 hypothetical protein SSBR45G_10710 [Bradyrhizobium sp. SSBR45G]GLH83353.1 hypothetical protein SSBR45R_08130 [Bradyrhizobium sp. SSBR45R]
MQANQVPPRRKSSITPQAALAAGVIVMFLLLHVLAGTILKGAATDNGAQAKQASTRPSTD